MRTGFGSISLHAMLWLPTAMLKTNSSSMANITNEFDNGLKMIEELTTNAEQILKSNAGTEYLSRYLNGEPDKELFRKNVPVVTYEDIKPYIDMIANGGTTNILLSQPITEFYLSSGTSGGQQKLFPVTAKLSDRIHILDTLNTLLTTYLGHFGNIDLRLEFMFGKQEIGTPSGLKSRSVTTCLYTDDNGYKNIISKFCTSPTETIFCPDINRSMYCQLLIGLIRRHEVEMVSSIFAATMVRVIKFLEDHWKELCSDIRSGQISERISDSGCRNAVASIIKPDPRLADSMENICSCKSWEGIIKTLWPKAKLINAITTGAMSQYFELLQFYSGGLPIVSSIYGSSEALCGINLELLSEPSHVSYTFLPNIAYFEFLPVIRDGLPMSQPPSTQDIEPVDLVHVKLGQSYELLVTSFAGLYRYSVGDVLKVTGFHNSTPQFQFVERQNVILSIDSDKTSEVELLKAVTDAKTLLDPLGFILTGYTSYANTCSIPGNYVLFWELKAKEGNESRELDPKVMTECCYRMEESLGCMYRNGKKENAIGALEIRVVKEGSFDALMDYYVSQGTSMSQYKTPSCIKSKVAINILDSKVTGKFLSPQNPML